MRLPDTTTFFILVIVGILLLVLLPVVPAADLPEPIQEPGSIGPLGDDLSTPETPADAEGVGNGSYDLRWLLGVGTLFAIILVTLLLLKRMPQN